MTAMKWNTTNEVALLDFSFRKTNSCIFRSRKNVLKVQQSVCIRRCISCKVHVTSCAIKAIFFDIEWDAHHGRPSCPYPSKDRLLSLWSLEQNEITCRFKHVDSGCRLFRKKERNAVALCNWCQQFRLVVRETTNKCLSFHGSCDIAETSRIICYALSDNYDLA